MKDYKQIWSFFASVKLALFTLCTLALTSIIGTVIPQHEQYGFYVKRYGDGMASFFSILDITHMYGSWWFLTLLGLLSTNLIICSIDRFPAVWKQIIADQSQVSVSRLEKMPFIHTVSGIRNINSKQIESLLQKQGWSTQRNDSEQGVVIAGQKGGWTRTGVYIVHASILIIFAGAIVGHFLGFKGSVMIPETKQTAKIYSPNTQVPIDLGFDVRCDHFDIEFYDNGMVKEYTSRLTILENGKEMQVKDIEVNSPLKYKGITFYQASYEGYRDFLITLKDTATGTEKTFVAPFQQQVKWAENDVIFGIVNAEALRDRVVRMKVWFKSGSNTPTTFWLESQEESASSENGTGYTLSVKQMYATGLQVAKDPGVLLVYLGCFLMMVGLYFAFFMSHRRVWLVLDPDDQEGILLIAGSTNKNKIGFEKFFSEFTGKITETIH
jgi:cytochrome c biogenesis protein